MEVVAKRLNVGNGTENDMEAEILDYSLVKARTKSLFISYMLCIPFGIFGLHHFYLRRIGFGFTYLCTGGFFFLGWIVDLFRLPSIVRATNDRIVRSNSENVDLLKLEKEKLVSDAYVMSLPPFGLLGFHHFYLGRYGFGCLYFCTLGLLGIGWFLDYFRMSYLVMRANRPLKRTTVPNQSECAETMIDIQEEMDGIVTMEEMKGTEKQFKRKRLDDAMILAFGPLGLLGFHQFYLGNLFIGFIYIITLANCGICWVADMFRILPLVKQKNNELDGKPGSQKKSKLQAYLLWLPPAGLIGAHQFYLERPCSGLIRSATACLFLVGWIYDFFVIPKLVKEYNSKQDLQKYITEVDIEMNPGNSFHTSRPNVSFDVDLINPFAKCCPNQNKLLFCLISSTNPCTQAVGLNVQ